MKPTGIWRVLMDIALAIVVIVILYVALRLYQQELYAEQDITDTQEQVSVTEEPITLTINGSVYETTHPIKTYLFIGTDASGNEEGTGEEYRGAMSDVLMLVALDEQDETSAQP